METDIERTIAKHESILQRLHTRRKQLLQSVDEEVQELRHEQLDGDDIECVDAMNDELTARLLETDYDELRQIDRALERIVEGTYGRCESCGRRIVNERLDVLPLATMCVRCQRAQDGQNEAFRIRPQAWRAGPWPRTGRSRRLEHVAMTF